MTIRDPDGVEACRTHARHRSASGLPGGLLARPRGPASRTMIRATAQDDPSNNGRWGRPSSMPRITSRQISSVSVSSVMPAISSSASAQRFGTGLAFSIRQGLEPAGGGINGARPGWRGSDGHVRRILTSGRSMASKEIGTRRPDPRLKSESSLSLRRVDLTLKLVRADEPPAEELIVPAQSGGGERHHDAPRSPPATWFRADQAARLVAPFPRHPRLFRLTPRRGLLLCIAW